MVHGVIWPALAGLQSGKAGSAHGGGDGLDGGEQRVEQESQAAGGALDLALLVQHEPRERHCVHVDLGLWNRWGDLRHGCLLSGQQSTVVISLRRSAHSYSTLGDRKIRASARACNAQFARARA